MFRYKRKKKAFKFPGYDQVSCPHDPICMAHQNSASCQVTLTINSSRSPPGLVPSTQTSNAMFGRFLCTLKSTITFICPYELTSHRSAPIRRRSSESDQPHSKARVGHFDERFCGRLVGLHEESGSLPWLCLDAF